jgi:hypothetical protein
MKFVIIALFVAFAVVRLIGIVVNNKKKKDN